MDPTNRLVLHFASGASLFSGAVLLLLAVLFAWYLRRGWWRTLRDILAILGAALMLLSATPGPPGLGYVIAIGTLMWIITERIKRDRAMQGAKFLRALIACLILLSVGLELPYRFMPQLPAAMHDHIVVLGDSISRGIVKEVDWPRSFAARHQIPALNLARNGATAEAALELQAPAIPPDATLIILEIGGNDMLGGTPVEQFAKDLDKLLASISKPGRTIVMLEIPLPPTFEQWGRVQRVMAKKHDVVLVPKSHFCRVLATPDGSADGLHLSATGADAMADILYELLAEHLRPPATPR